MSVPPRASLVVDSDAWGGAEVYALHLLACAGDNGWRASLVCSEPVCEPFLRQRAAESIAVVPLARHAAAAPATRAALTEQGPDVLLVNLVDPISNAAVLEAALSVGPTVATLHLRSDPRHPLSAADVVRVRCSYRRLAAAVTPASDARSQMVEELGVLEERLHVVHNGVVPPARVRRAWHSPPRIGAFGRLTEQKGFDVLLQSLGMLLDEGVGVEAVIGGEGRDRDRLEALAEGLPVTMPGFVRDVPAFLAGVDLFCLPSRREALPLTLLEAMGAGLACVSSDVGDVRSALDGAVRVVPPDQPAVLARALGDLLHHPEAAAELGRRAQGLVAERFHRSVMAARTYDVLRSVLVPAPR